jgi:hypothetical protein
MRTSVITGLFAVAALMTATSAHADTWCRNGSMCVFGSYQQCASAVRVMGGVCARETSRYTPAPRYSETRVSAGRASYAQYSSSPLPTNLHPSRFSCSNVN